MPSFQLRERDCRMFEVNNSEWNLRFVEPCNDMLKRSDGTYTLGVTDGKLKCVFIADNLSGFMTRKVLCHELCHVFCISYEVYMSIEEEERLADWISLYGTELVYLLDDLMGILKKVA